MTYCSTIMSQQPYYYALNISIIVTVKIESEFVSHVHLKDISTLGNTGLCYPIRDHNTSASYLTRPMVGS